MTTLEPTTTKFQATVEKAYKIFFSPTRYEVKPSEQEVVDWGANYRLPYAGGELAVTTWGETDRPAVLLMHGWGGARAQMTGFVDPLLFAGFRVVSYDQPGHGESSGRTTNVLEIAPSMDLIQEKEGPFRAIIAHSFGTLITSYSLTERNLPPPAKLVYFGAFNRLLDSLPRFQLMAGLSDEVTDGLLNKIYEDFGKDVLDNIANESMTQKIDIPALMFHDTADAVTPVEDSRAIARVWKKAQYFETNGLGHRGALQSKQIHEQVIQFLKGE